jgi:hypothetical protein
VDEIFLQFARGLFLLMVTFAVGMFIVILFGDATVGLRMVNAFASMFAGLLGLGSGYILGRQTNGKEDRHDRS